MRPTFSRFGALALGLLSSGPAVQGCSSASSPEVSLNGVYVSRTPGAGAYRELGFYDSSHYFLWKNRCSDGDTGADCLEQGTYVVGANTLRLTDESSGEMTALPFSVASTQQAPASPEDLHLLGDMDPGGLTGGNVALTNDASSLVSWVLQFVLAGQTFLVWGPNGLTGNFSSVVCESVPDGTYQLRHYAFGASSAQAVWERYSAPSCSTQSKLMTIVLSGTAKVNGLAPNIAGAADITVNIASKTVTPTAAGIQMLHRDCDGAHSFQPDVQANIDTGCGGLLGQTDDCAAEYDLMALRASGLVFGDRSHPLCSDTTRPTALSQWSVVPGTGYVSPGE